MFDPLNYPLFITKNPLTIMNSPLNITIHPLFSYAIKIMKSPLINTNLFASYKYSHSNNNINPTLNKERSDLGPAWMATHKFLPNCVNGFWNDKRIDK